MAIIFSCWPLFDSSANKTRQWQRLSRPKNEWKWFCTNHRLIRNQVAWHSLVVASAVVAPLCLYVPPNWISGWRPGMSVNKNIVKRHPQRCRRSLSVTCNRAFTSPSFSAIQRSSKSLSCTNNNTVSGRRINLWPPRPKKVGKSWLACTKCQPHYDYDCRRAPSTSRRWWGHNLCIRWSSAPEKHELALDLYRMRRWCSLFDHDLTPKRRVCHWEIILFI